MLRTCIFCLFASVVSLDLAVGQDSFPANAVVWTLGDSRVEGNRPEFESYRYYLWQNLVREGRSFDLIGTSSDDAQYADFMGRQFDRDHDGYGGIRSDQLLGEMDELFSQLPLADIALLGVGGNDLLEDFGHQHALTNLDLIIGKLQADNPNMTIFVEQIAPARQGEVSTELLNELALFNQGVANIAATRNSDMSRVIAVDMATGWQESWFADAVHYNERGAREVANRYTSAINARFQSVPEPSTSVVAGIALLVLVRRRKI